MLVCLRGEVAGVFAHTQRHAVRHGMVLCCESVSLPVGLVLPEPEYIQCTMQSGVHLCLGRLRRGTADCFVCAFIVSNQPLLP